MRPSPVINCRSDPRIKKCSLSNADGGGVGDGSTIGAAVTATADNYLRRTRYYIWKEGGRLPHALSGDADALARIQRYEQSGVRVPPYTEGLRAAEAQRKGGWLGRGWGSPLADLPVDSS